MTGRVKSLGAGDAQLFFNRPGWETSFELQPWRLDGAPIDSRTLRVILGNLDRDTALSFLESSSTGSVVRFRIEHAPDPENPAPELFATAFDGTVMDPELSEFVVPALVFPPFEHARFGTFTKPNDYSNYAATMTWAGSEVSLQLDGAFADLPEAARHAEAMVDRAPLWQADMADRIHRDLFALWHDVWREDCPTLDKDAWLSRIRPTSVTIDPRGQFLAYFDDGDLFWNHTIEVSGSLLGGSTEASIVG